MIQIVIRPHKERLFLLFYGDAFGAPYFFYQHLPFMWKIFLEKFPLDFDSVCFYIYDIYVVVWMGEINLFLIYGPFAVVGSAVRGVSVLVKGRGK